MVGQDEGRNMIGWLLAPPSFPCVVRPRSAHRSKHVTAQNPRAYVLHTPPRPLVINTSRTTFVAVHLLPCARREKPLKQFRTSNAKGIFNALPRPSGVTIKRYRKCAYPDFAHVLILT